MTTELLLFAVAAAIGELLPFPKPRGRDLSISVAVVAAYALLGHGLLEVLVVAVGGWLIAAAVRASHGSSSPRSDLVLAIVSGISLTGAVELGGLVTGPVLDSGVGVGELVAAWSVVLFGLPAAEAVERTRRRHGRFVPTYLGVLRENAGGGIALSASAALGAIAHGVLGAWSVPLVLLPLLAARVGLARYTQVRITYDQTVRAMSRLPEELGTVARGHGVRVGELAVAVARELGLSDREVERVERAAHLHELGQIRADLGKPLNDRTVALAGASILREAGSLEDVADLVERHRDPYRHGQRDDPAVAVGARIVRGVCEFDRAAIEGRGEHVANRALDRLHQIAGDDLDPRVLDALQAVLARQGRLGRGSAGSIAVA